MSGLASSSHSSSRGSRAFTEFTFHVASRTRIASHHSRAPGARRHPEVNPVTAEARQRRTVAPARGSFHDHEGFGTAPSTKAFAIMAVRPERGAGGPGCEAPSNARGVRGAGGAGCGVRGARGAGY